MEKRVYSAINEVSAQDVELEMLRDDPHRLREIVIAVGLHDSDRLRAESICKTLSVHPHEEVRGNAILGLGHIARRFRCLSDHLKSVIEHGLKDNSEYVRAQSQAAADDATFFLGWDINGFNEGNEP